MPSVLAIMLVFTAATCVDGPQSDPAPSGMRWIPAGEFLFGSDDARALPNEKPSRRVRISGFWMDQHDVTNAEFGAFIAATGYVTTAERPVDWDQMKTQVPDGTPRPPDEMLKPGSLVFTPPGREVDLRDLSGWWTWTPGANWRHPEGPGSTIEGREKHPVVQVSWDDAAAYAKWAGKRLPTEAEWEYAARGGREGTRFSWGEEFKVGGKFMCNAYTGRFPVKDTAEDGYAGTSPVGSFPPNGYGLFDMGGNVWNWCADFYADDLHAREGVRGVCENPAGPGATRPAHNPLAIEHVIKGGSFLCSVQYCESYRPSARRGTPPDTGSGHVGFRCARSAGVEGREGGQAFP